MFWIAALGWLAAATAAVVLVGRGGTHHRSAGRSMYWCAAVVAVLVGAAPLVTPAVMPSNDPTEFDTDRALEHVEVIAAEPHPIGSAANADVRRYIAAQLSDLGLDPEFQRISVPDYFGQSGTVPVVNVAARISGTSSTGSVALVAHFDTVPATSGANDNAVGVAVVLETARSLLAAGPLRNDVILLFTDGEEPAPRYGSSAFVDEHRWFEDIRFVVNLEAIGCCGPSMISEISGPQSWVLDRAARSIPQPVAYSFLTETTRLIGGSNTDFAPFRDAGIAGMEFVYARGSPIYHTAADDPSSVSRRSVHSHGVNTLALTRRVGTDDLSQVGGGDRVFFTIGRHYVMQYPIAWSVAAVALVGVLATLARWGGRRWRPMLESGLVSVAAALGGAVVASIVWMVFAGWRDTMGVFESYGCLLILSAVAGSVLFIALPSRGPIIQRVSPEGVIAVWWTLSAVAVWAAPGASALVGLPAVAGALALAVASSRRSRRFDLSASLVLVVVVCVMVMPAIDIFFQFAQPRPGNRDSEILATVAVPVFLIGLTLQTVAAFRPRTPAHEERPDR